MVIAVRPIKQELRFNGKLIGCTDTCLAMAANAQARGGLHITEAIVRAESGEQHPDPSSPGLNQMQLERVATRLHFDYSDQSGHSWAAFGKAVSARRLVIASLWYADIGGTPIGHAVLVNGRIGKLYAIIDPMKGKQGTVSPTKLHRAMATFADKANWPAGELIYGVTRVVPA
jgi:hypothetical protein